MSFDDMFEDTKEVVKPVGENAPLPDRLPDAREGRKLKPTKPSKSPKKKMKTMKTSNLDDETIEEVMRGGETIDDEINRPFWKFPQLPDYPYDHFVPAYIMMYGDKGAGKTSAAFSVPGNIFALTFEKRGNLTRPWKKIFACHPRIQPFGLSEFVERGSTGKYRDSSNTVYSKIIQLMLRAIKHSEKFDWVVIDGLQRGQKITTQRMKALNSVGAFDNLPTKLLTRWGERTLYLENIVMDLASQIASKGVIMTSQNVEKRAMFLTKAQEDAGVKIEDLPIKTPAWWEKIRDDTDTMVAFERSEEVLGKGRSKLKWSANILTNKLGGTGKHDITLHDNPKATINLIEEILTSDIGFEPVTYE